MSSWVGTTKDCCGGFLLDNPQEGTLKRLIALAVVLVALIALPVYAQSRLTLNSQA